MKAGATSTIRIKFWGERMDTMLTIKNMTGIDQNRFRLKEE